MFDVVVAGGGPAGLAVAAALRLRGRSVALFERTAYEGPRVGETLGPEVFVLLRALGAWGAVGDLVEGQVPLRSVRAAWGAGDLDERPSIVHPLGEGRHVERVRFDAALAAWAESTGVVLRRDAGACRVSRDAGGLVVEPARGEPAPGRYFVDASGRGAPAGAGLGGRTWLALDREVALVARMGAGRELGWELLLEAAEEGFWYSAPQADGTLVVALVTDADLVPAGARSSLGDRFARALARTTHTAARCEGTEVGAPLRIVRADSGRLLPHRGRDWCAVGDAAMAGDPLAGNGVAAALRSAIETAERIDAALRGAEEAAPSPLEARFLAYLDRRASYYALEARWPEAPFWARRRPVAWKSAPITLAPTTLLRQGTDGGRASLAKVEALLPPRAIVSTLAVVKGPTPAHVVLSALRDAAPLGDRRLLVGLQMLVAAGALTAA